MHSGDGQVTITYTANPTPANPTPTAGEHPNCKKLRKKLKRQQKGLANAGTEAKRAMIQANIKDTKKRLKKRGCKSQHPNCKKLRKKLMRQHDGLAEAGSEAKRAMIQANIKDTNKRLKKRGCKPASK